MSYERFDDMSREADMIWALLDGPDKEEKKEKEDCQCQQQDGIAMKLLKFLFGNPPQHEEPPHTGSPHPRPYHNSVYQPVANPRHCPPPPTPRPQEPVYQRYSDLVKKHETQKVERQNSLVPKEQPRPQPVPPPPPPPPRQAWAPQEPLQDPRGQGHYVSDRAMGLMLALTASAALIVLTSIYNAVKSIKEQLFPE